MLGRMLQSFATKKKPHNGAKLLKRYGWGGRIRTSVSRKRKARYALSTKPVPGRRSSLPRVAPALWQSLSHGCRTGNRPRLQSRNSNPCAQPEHAADGRSGTRRDCRQQCVLPGARRGPAIRVCRNPPDRREKHRHAEKLAAARGEIAGDPTDLSARPGSLFNPSWTAPRRRICACEGRFALSSRPRTALTLALAFPLIFAGLFIAAILVSAVRAAGQSAGHLIQGRRCHPVHERLVAAGQPVRRQHSFRFSFLSLRGVYTPRRP
jgi:hypothetical protein